MTKKRRLWNGLGSRCVSNRLTPDFANLFIRAQSLTLSLLLEPHLGVRGAIPSSSSSALRLRPIPLRPLRSKGRLSYSDYLILAYPPFFLLLSLSYYIDNHEKLVFQVFLHRTFYKFIRIEKL